jgi:uncharacterized protein YggE
MNTSIKAILVFFAALFVYTKLAGPIPFSLSSIVTNKTDTFTVTGEGKVTAVPDIAVLDVGVQAQGTTVTQVQEAINSKSNTIIATVKKLGVDDKDIQTINYSLSPTYDYQSATQRITGYQANSTLLIKVRKTENANSVIDAATAAGANQVGGVSFDVSDKTKAENEARDVAIAEAKRKAETAAKAAGFTLGRVINYSEGFGGVMPMPMYAKADTAMMVGNPERSATQIETGSSEIVVTVSLSYEIR